jgi:hypothetical protein
LKTGLRLQDVEVAKGTASVTLFLSIVPYASKMQRQTVSLSGILPPYYEKSTVQSTTAAFHFKK